MPNSKTTTTTTSTIKYRQWKEENLSSRLEGLFQRQC